jgi:transposase-like protein
MTNDSPLLVTAADAARLLNVSASQLYKWRREHYGPEPVLVGKPGARRPSIRYRRADLLEFAGVNVE